MAKFKNYPVDYYDNLKQMYHASAEKFGEKTAFLQKINGKYEEISFRQYCADVDALGTELCARGLSGKRVMVVGENCYQWVTAYMAVVSGTGVVVPVDKEIPPEELANIANISEAAAIIYSSKLEQKVEALENIEKYSFDGLADMIECGREKIRRGDRTFLDAEIDNKAMSILLFTSGTTGVSKGVMLSHRSVLFVLEDCCQMTYLGPDDRYLSVLPVHHVYECTCGFLAALYRGSSLAFAEGLRYITRNMQEVNPTIVNCVPLLAETVYHKVWANIRKQGMEKTVKTMIKLTNAIPERKMRMAAKRKVFAQIHKSFGGKLRLLLVGGAAADPKILDGLEDLGLACLQGYGLSECAPIVAFNRDTYYRSDSAGLATPNGLVDIYDVQDDGTGEIRYKGENIMLGYFKQPELTAEVIRDGWLYTGDLGYIDDNGFVHITGRKKNVIVTSNGKNIFPEELETYLCRNKYIAESVVVGYVNPKKKDYDIVALIYPDYDQVQEDFGRNYTFDQLDREMKKAISEVNGVVQSYKRIETYILRKEEFPKNTSRKIKRMGLADAAYPAYLQKVNG